MALIIRGKTLCPICGKVINEHDDIVSSPHFIGDAQDPLAQFSDAGMHAACFRTWDQKETFIDRFNAIAGNVIFGNGTYRHMEADGSISVLKK